MDAELNKEVARLKNLKGNKQIALEELERQASINLKVREFKSNPLFIDPDEIKLSTDRFKAYLEANELESMSEIDTLRSLIYNEVFEIRIQKQLNKMAEDNKAPYDKITKQLTDIQNQKLTFENGANSINNEFNEASSEIEKDLTKMMEENNQFLDIGFITLKEHTFKVTNIYEINHTELISDLKQLFENMSISFTSLVNSLESKLGDEYRNLLEYFEKTKETTMGTAKNLLEDLTNLLTNQIDKIWTNALKELNTLQEKTQTTRVHQTLKNKLLETNVKIKNVIQNQIKGGEIALEMLESSIKMSFDDLNSQMREASERFSKKTKEIK